MKPFDIEAAIKGARVCTMDGANRVLIDFSDRTMKFYGTTCYPLFGYVMDNRSGTFKEAYFTEDGICSLRNKSNFWDLMMADDDYLEKLERDEYENVVFLSPSDEAYWLKQYAGMAMQGLSSDWEYKKMATDSEGGAINTIVYNAVKMACVLVNELKKLKSYD